jgi:Holliday junction DNA helicase RuvA
VGENLELEIHTIVREEEITLYGFRELAECQFFGMLVSVNGIGPKMALAVLGHCPWRELARAIDREDIARIRAVKGVGEKTAKLLVLALKKKILPFLLPAGGEKSVGATSEGVTRSVELALLNLGYSRADIQKTLAKVAITPDSPLQGVIKESLQILSRHVMSGDRR